MSTGLLALLDDVAAIAKVAAASLDDVAAHVAKAGAKSAGLVIDDAAVTPRYVVGFAAARELPIIGKITKGSLKNKLLFLLPAALALSVIAPWAITPLLMLGGVYLCYEGAEKIFGVFFPHQAHAHEVQRSAIQADPQALEDQKVASAIRTDFILSAEIMAIALATVSDTSFLTKTIVLAIVGVGITLGVYGAVALIVKADDVGVAMAGFRPGKRFGTLTRAFGRGLVRFMPFFLKALTVVGTIAMLWVGGGIIVHALEGYGFSTIGDKIHHVAAATQAIPPDFTGAVEWIVTATGAGLVGLAIGAIMIPLVSLLVMPLWKSVRN